MRIGIVGPPGSGKTDLALNLREGYDQEIEIIDNYAENVRDMVGLGIGSVSDYLGNLHIALERERRERHVDDDHDDLSRITCGTMLETACYLALHGGTLRRSDPMYHYHYTRMEASMPFFGLLVNDFFKYDQVFWLTRSLEYPGYYGALEDQIAMAMQEWRVPYATLGENNRLEQATQILKENFEASETDEQTVR